MEINTVIKIKRTFVKNENLVFYIIFTSFAYTNTYVLFLAKIWNFCNFLKVSPRHRGGRKVELPSYKTFD